MNYKWTNPYNWLAKTARGWSKASLYNALCLLAEETDPGTIQDIFQQEMDEDGYSKELETITTDEVGSFEEEIGI